MADLPVGRPSQAGRSSTAVQIAPSEGKLAIAGAGEAWVLCCARKNEMRGLSVAAVTCPASLAPATLLPTPLAMASGRLALPPRQGGSAEQRKRVSDEAIADAVEKLSGAPVGAVERLAGAPPALTDLAAAAEAAAAGGSTGKKRKAEEASPPAAAAADGAATVERQTTGGRSRRSNAGKKPLRTEFDDDGDSWDDESEEDSPPKGEAAAGSKLRSLEAAWRVARYGLGCVGADTGQACSALPPPPTPPIRLPC